MVFLMPLNVGRHERSFWVHVRLVMARVRIEEAHERTVRNKRHDARTLIFEGLKPSVPEKDDNQPRRAIAMAARSARAAISKMEQTLVFVSEVDRYLP
jgi:hypothetical protein